MKFQVAAWWFPQQGCVGTRQCSLGALAVPDICGARQWVPISLAEAQTLPESKLQNLLQNKKNLIKNKYKKPASADKTKPSINMPSKCSKKADFSNADTQNLLEVLEWPGPGHLHACCRPDPALCGEVLRSSGRFCLVLSSTQQQALALYWVVVVTFQPWEVLGICASRSGGMERAAKTWGG